jgi:hypothetical protein
MLERLVSEACSVANSPGCQWHRLNQTKEKHCWMTHGFDFDTTNNAWNGLFALSENCKLGQVDLHAAKA